MPIHHSIKNFISKQKENFWDEYFNHSHFIPVFIGLGIIIYFNIKFEPSLINIIINFIISFFLFYTFKKKILKISHRPFIIFIFYITSIYSLITFGFLSAKIHTLIHEKPLIKEKLFLKKSTGQIKKILYYNDKEKMCFIIKNLKSANKNLSQIIQSNSLIRICSKNYNLYKLKIGDSISINNLSLKPLPFPIFKLDYQFARNAFFENIIGTGYSNEIEKIFPLYKLTLLDKINIIRFDFSKKIVNEFGEDIGSIISALTVGDRSYLSNEAQENMKKSSIFHIIAISGLHMSILGIFLHSIIKRISVLFLDRHIKHHVLERTSLLVSLIAISLFLAFSGITLSAQRAVIMILIVNMTIFKGQQVISRKVIGYTVISILIIQPHSLLNPGLQMSIFAVFSLIFFDIKPYENDINICLKNCKNKILQKIKILIYITKLTLHNFLSRAIKCSTWNIFKTEIINAKHNNKKQSENNINIKYIFYEKHINCSTWNNFKKMIHNFKKTIYYSSQKNNYTNKAYSTTTQNVPRGTFLKNKIENGEHKMFHVEHFEKDLSNIENNNYSKNKIQNTNISNELLNNKKCSTWNIFKTEIINIKSNNTKQSTKDINLKSIFYKKISAIREIVPRGTILIFNKILYSIIPHLTIMPITLFYFQNAATYTVITNLIAIPLALIIMLFIILYLTSKMFHVEQFSEFFKKPLEISINLLNKISHYCGNLPSNYIKIHQISSISFCILITGIIWILIWQKSWRFYGAILYFFGLILCSTKTLPDIIIYNNQNKQNIIINLDHKLCAIQKQNNFISKKFLEYNNQKELIMFKNVPRGTFLKKETKDQEHKMFHVEHFKKDLLNIDNKLLNNKKCSTWNIFKTEIINTNNNQFQNKNKNINNPINCSTWNNFKNQINLAKSEEIYNVYITNNKILALKSSEHIGNRPWSIYYDKK